MDKKLFIIPPTEIDVWWPNVRSLVENACEYSGGRYGVEDILDYLLSGAMQLWVVMDKHEIVAITITEIVNFPRLKECRMLACTGVGMNEWVGLIVKIEDWAKQNGCSKITPICRPGWERILKDYKKCHIQLEKNI